MKKILLIFSLVTIGYCGVAQENAYQMMQNFLKDRKYHLGFDTDRKRITTIGVSEFKCDDLKSKILPAKRAIYMKVAVLDARAEVIKTISSNVTAQEEYKSVAVFDSQKGDMSAENFSSAISCLAAMPLQGVVTINHAESYDPSRKLYQIAVAVGWSAKSEAYALGKKAPRPRPDKKPGTVREFLEGAKNAYGIRTFIDKNGKIWYLGIAQYPLKNGYSVAKRFASTEALGMINFSLNSAINVQDHAIQLMKKRENVKNENSNQIIEALVNTLGQKVERTSKASMLSTQEVVNPISGTKYLSVAYGYSPTVISSTVKNDEPASSSSMGKSKEKDSNGWVTAVGDGSTKSLAVKSALAQALMQVIGGSVKADDEINRKYKSVIAKLNDKEASGSVSIDEYKNNIKSSTQGLIDEYRIISYTEIRKNHWEATLRVKVYNGKRVGQFTVVIMPTVCENENAIYELGKDKRLSAARIALDIRRQIENSLTSTNKFDIIDRANIGKVIKEQALTVNMVKAGMSNIRELIKAGNNLSADFMILSKLLSCKYSSKGKFDPKKGRVRRIRTMRVKMEFKILDVYDGSVLLNKEADIRLSGKKLDDALENEDNLIKLAATEAFKEIQAEFVKAKGRKPGKKRRRMPSSSVLNVKRINKPISEEIESPKISKRQEAFIKKTVPKHVKGKIQSKAISTHKAQSLAPTQASALPETKEINLQFEKFNYTVKKFILDTDAIYGKGGH